MPHFIKLTHQITGEPIWLNTAMIESIAAQDGGSEVFAQAGGDSGYRVRQTPNQILDMIEAEADQ